MWTKELCFSPFHVKRCYNLGDCQVLGNGARHTHLINLQVRIWCDDCSSREVDPFSHEVAPYTPLLAFQSLFDWLQRTATSLESLQNIKQIETSVTWLPHDHTRGRPGSSLSTIVATWNCSILTSSCIIWGAAPFFSFLMSCWLDFTMSANLWVRSSYKKQTPQASTMSTQHQLGHKK